jgi:uncharacterized membrane protein YhaH (DUF805 family)
MENPYQAPQGQILTPTGGQNPITWKEILFSFKGRIPRRQFWGGSLIAGLILIVPMLLMSVLENSESGAVQAVSGIVMLILFVIYFWAALAIQTKRWHDRDKSGWWFFIAFVPIIGGIWSFIETGCLRGTEGPNRYGDDPT